MLQNHANILSMATYVYSEQQIDKMLSRTRRLEVWVCVVGALILLAFGFLAYFRLGFFAHHGFRRDWAIGIFIAIGFDLLFTSFRRKKSGSEKLRAILKEWSLEISPAGVCLTGFRQRKVLLTREEISRAEEPSLGRVLFLRTSRRYRYARISRDLDDYEAIKREIILLGIPIEKTLLLPNWEELLLVVLFLGALLCAVGVPLFL